MLDNTNSSPLDQWTLNTKFAAVSKLKRKFRDFSRASAPRRIVENASGAGGVTGRQNCQPQPQTLAWTPRLDLLPQTPDRPPQPLYPSGAALGGFEGAAVDGMALPSSAPLDAVKPWDRGDGRGVVERLLRAGLGAWAPAEGRVPMGATVGPLWLALPGATPCGGEPPVGDELLVRLACWPTALSKTPKLVGGFDCGLELPSARAWLGVSCGDWPSGPTEPEPRP